MRVSPLDPLDPIQPICAELLRRLHRLDIASEARPGLEVGGVLGGAEADGVDRDAFAAVGEQVLEVVEDEPGAVGAGQRRGVFTCF